MNLFKLTGLYLLFHAGLAIAEAPRTLCTSQEKVYFSCALHRKVVSLCATSQNSPTETYLQYRIGKPGISSDIELPNENVKAKDFFRYNFQSRSAKGSIFNITFDSGDYNYTIYRFTHAFEGNSSGVAVKKQGKIVSYLKCDETSVIANFSDINAFSFAKNESVEIVEGPE